MKYYIISGEASGDLHGSNLIKELHKKDKTAEIRCWGGDLMEEAGATLVRHYKDLAFMGFIEVVAHLKTILTNISFCKTDIEEFKPDAVILVDYPGFNLRIAAWAHQAGFRVIYYISPQVWAWKEGRVKKIRRSVDKMITILPFEKEFYAKKDFEVDYVGHPLLPVIKAAQVKDKGELITNKKIIALLPGSRSQEILKKLPIMLKMVPLFPEYDFVIACASQQDDLLYEGILKDSGVQGVLRVKNETYRLLQQAEAALVTSGTATLETALFGVPQVVCYKGSPISYFLAKRFIKTQYISLVNLILDKKAVPELIQSALNKQQLQEQLSYILSAAGRTQQIEDYKNLWGLLDEGNASEKAAKLIIQFLSSDVSSESKKK